MANKKRFLEAAAGRLFGLQTASAAIEDVFSTYLYTGNGSTQTITNGIDLAGEGGLVWIKNRTNASSHALFDTERGAQKLLFSESTSAEQDRTLDNDSLYPFNSDGFGLQASAGNRTNESGSDFVSWTFRKAEKFFDVVTYTGDGTNGRQIAHNLAHEVGCCIIKKTSASGDWWVYHRGASANSFGILNGANSFTTSSINSEFASEVFGDGNSFQAPTDTFIEVSSFASNENGTEYVAYLFAHDPLGPSGDGSDGLIACGSYTGNGNTDGPTVTLGWEPQWLMIRGTGGGDWQILDNMRGIHSGGTNDARLFANSSDAEYNSIEAVQLQATGFKIDGTTGGVFNGSGSTYIYIAIRRGPMRVPESGTEVFAIDSRGSGTPGWTSNFPADGFIGYRSSINAPRMGSRLQGQNYMETYQTSAESSDGNLDWDLMDGIGRNLSALSDQYLSMFRRAPGFFDVVAYTGNGVAGRTVPHNLGVAPELMIVKKRSGADEWPVYSSALGTATRLTLNTASANAGLSNYWNNTAPTESVFSLSDRGEINASGQTFIAYLFASTTGVSKVGSYIGNGSSQTINCGFTSGARFVLIKRTDSTGDWYVWDTTRGIVTGNDPFLELNTTDAEVTSDDSIDPDSSGFIVNQTATTNVNVSGGNYIFLAIA